MARYFPMMTLRKRMQASLPFLFIGLLVVYIIAERNCSCTNTTVIENEHKVQDAGNFMKMKLQEYSQKISEKHEHSDICAYTCATREATKATSSPTKTTHTPAESDLTRFMPLPGPGVADMSIHGNATAQSTGVIGLSNIEYNPINATTLDSPDDYVYKRHSEESDSEIYSRMQKDMQSIDDDDTANHTLDSFSKNPHSSQDYSNEWSNNGTKSRHIQEGVRSIVALLTNVSNAINESARQHKAAKSSVNICKGYVEEYKLNHTVLRNVFGGGLNSSWPVCLVTQLTHARFSMLQKVAEHWQGCISAAIYVHESSFIQSMSSVKAWLDSTGRTNIAVHYMIEQGEYYPVNKLRNIAQYAVMSEYIFLIDVDFIPSKPLEQHIRNYINAGFFDSEKLLFILAFILEYNSRFGILQLINNRGLFYIESVPLSQNKTLIVPALEMQKSGVPYPTSKTKLLSLMRKKTVNIFHISKFRRAHEPTNFTAWKTAQSPYKIKYLVQFEPYIVIKRELSPKYDERFLQRFYNKAVHISELHARGFEFWVLPEGYLVHMPHKYEKKKSNSIYNCARRVWLRVERGHAKLKARLKKDKMETSSPIEGKT